MRTRLFICVIERATRGNFNWAGVNNSHCVIVPTPHSGTSDESPWQWWVERVS